MKKIIILIIVLVVIFTGIYLYKNINPKPFEVMCTEEAKICPDGSVVGRSGPKCEFAACPGEALPLR